MAYAIWKQEEKKNQIFTPRDVIAAQVDIMRDVTLKLQNLVKDILIHFSFVNYFKDFVSIHSPFSQHICKLLIFRYPVNVSNFSSL